MESEKMLKMYVPDGNLEPFVLGLLEGAGFEPERNDREYKIRTNSNTWDFKQLRPQDQPYYVAKGYAELCIVGQDILQEFQLGYLDIGSMVEILDVFEGRPTKLVAVVLEENYKGIKDLKTFLDAESENLMIASEYPQITKNYILENYGIAVDVYRPQGKTEATLIGERPEMNLIIETTETGNTIRAAGGIILETLMESKQVAVVNSKAYSSQEKRDEINNILEQFRGVMRVKKDNLQQLKLNVFDSGRVESVIEYLIEQGYRPTVSNIYPDGSDICVVLPNSDIKDISPSLYGLGCIDMVVAPMERLLYPST
ncbi:MAG: ATP phosphoribosyltransferase [archaeon]|nr:ATP phosphoribosyltransferase [archaeon]